MEAIKSTLSNCELKVPTLRTMTFCILLITCYHAIMVTMYYFFHPETSTSHALLSTERLDFISTHLREMYRIKRLIEDDPHQVKTPALEILLQDLKSLEEVITPWDMIDMKRAKKQEEKIQKFPQDLEVCPESYLGSAYGEPLYEEGFEVAHCDSKGPLRTLLTILLNFHDSKKAFVYYGVDMIISLNQAYPEIPIIIAVPVGMNIHDLPFKKSLPSLTFLQVAKNRHEGDVWNDLVNNAKTKYVFLGRNLTHFHVEDANLERLVREMANLGIDFIGGSTKSIMDGQWRFGCEQISHKNYHINYKQGYRKSEHGCAYCDGLQGPFVARARALRSRTLDRKLPLTTVFNDFFLRLKRARIKTVLCPDAMFYVEKNTNNQLDLDRNTWLPVAEKWKLNKISLHGGHLIEYECSEIGTKCNERFSPGKSIPPCCLRTMSRTVKIVLDKCERLSIACELQSTFLLGAVKMGKALPWQRSAFITFLSSNDTAMGTLTRVLKEEGLILRKEQSTFCCKEGRQDGGVYRVVPGKSELSVIMEGQYKTTSEVMTKAGFPSTRVAIGEESYRAPRNPGLYLRNRYGLEILRHKESRTWEKNEETEAMGFLPCASNKDHDCLDSYESDGSLQFDGE